MRIERVAFNNFRAYQGSFELTFPLHKDETRSVYLIGGENGAGKTSFLMALGIALYGVDSEGISFRSGRRNRDEAYAATLEDCFNRRAAAEGKDSMSVSIELGAFGERFEIHRQWWFAEGHFIDEDIRVRANGQPIVSSDHDITTYEGRNDAVAQLMESVLPARAARFFFFDGEEVASIAERDLGKSVIAGLDDLLGLDSILRLTAELNRIERRERDALRSSNTADLLERVRQSHSDCEALSSLAASHLQYIREELQSAEDQLEKTKDELSSLFRGHDVVGLGQLQSDLDQNLIRLEESNRDLARALGDSLCAISSMDILGQLESRAADAIAKSQRGEIRSQAKTLLVQALDVVFRREFDPPLDSAQMQQIELFMHDAIEQLASTSNDGVAEALNVFSTTDLVRLSSKLSMLKHREAFGQLREQASQRQELRQQNLDIEANLRRFQESSIAADLISRRSQLSAEIFELRDTLEQSEVAAQEAEDRLKQAHDSLVAAEESLVDSNLSAAKISVTRKARRALDNFAQEIRIRRAFELEGHVSKMLRLLLHRAGALERVKIETASSTVTLLDGRGQEVPVPSAGEKEIFALSLIHGLGKLSHRSAPLVIDTPLGRLDKAHRNAIVRSFMPTASNQVIVLSTDSEIDDALYGEIEPFLAYQATIRSTESGPIVDVGTYFTKAKR